MENARASPSSLTSPLPPLVPCPQVRRGCCNLQRHIENARAYGIPVVIAINQFAADTEAELEAVRQAAMDAGVESVGGVGMGGKRGWGGLGVLLTCVRCVSEWGREAETLMGACTLRPPPLRADADTVVVCNHTRDPGRG